jgi:hypothetical protein
MLSKAIASLDAWLAQAEGVLAEQREHAISPSLGLLERREQHEVTITLTTLSAGLEGLLASLCGRPGRWILVVEREADGQFLWQALAYEDGSLVTEVVSNNYLEGVDRWTPAQEQRLTERGWEPPSLKRPNWIGVEETTMPDVGAVVDRSLSTLRELFGFGEDDQLRVKMFSSPNRGNTPAGPEYEPDTGTERVVPARHYFRPDLDQSDEELGAEIETLMEMVLGPASP